MAEKYHHEDAGGTEKMALPEENKKAPE